MSLGFERWPVSSTFAADTIAFLKTHESTSPISKKSESPPSPLPPVSVFGPNKFSPAPPITSSYFLSGTALRKQSELRVRGGLDSQQLTRQEAEKKRQREKLRQTRTHEHTCHMHPLSSQTFAV